MAKCDESPNETPETRIADERVYPDDDLQVIADFFFALSANMGGEVERVSLGSIHSIAHHTRRTTKRHNARVHRAAERPHKYACERRGGGSGATPCWAALTLLARLQ